MLQSSILSTIVRTLTSVRFRGQADVPGLGVDDDQDGSRRGAISLDQVVDEDVVLMELRPCVIPTHDSLFSVDLLEHVVHVLEVLVIQEPDVPVLFVLVERKREGIGDVQDALGRPGAEQDSDDTPGEIRKQ